jgi:hypothetical protein
MRQLLWIIVPGTTVILVACAYNAGPGNVTMSIYRELGIDSTISAAVTPASAPSAPSKGK